MKPLSIFLILLLTNCLFNKFGFSQQTGNYTFDSLLGKANAVVLEETTKFVIKSENSAEQFYSCRILIKNKSAEKYGRFSTTQTEFWNVEDIKAVIKDTLGNTIKELEKSDIKTALLKPGYSYYSDKMYVYFDINYNIYPYVLEYSYKVDYKTLFFWPDWEPQFSVPCLSASLTLILDYPIKFNYKTIGNLGEPEKRINDGVTEYYWEIQNLPARIEENYAPPENKIQTAVLFSPDTFSLRDYKGSFKNWESLGIWYNNLTKGRYTLSETALKEVQNLVANVRTKKEKIKLLYNYLQEKNHYVAINLGIAGWQPQSAQEVFTNRYGDCKDLSTFMVSILKVAGINSYPALALTRDEGQVFKDFPSNQFNHCIVFVPLDGDSLWIECTARFMDLGDTPADIQGINVLVVNENGGNIVTTTIRKSAENLWVSKSKANLTVTGQLSFNIDLSLYGNQKNYFKSAFGYYSNDDDMALLKNNFGRHFNSINIDSFDVKDSHTTDGCFDISLDGTYSSVTPGAGKFVLLNPNLFNRKNPDTYPKENPEERKFPIYYDYPYIDIDSVEIKIPAGYNLLAKPENINLETKFGKYSSEYDFKDGKIYYYRKFEIVEREIPLIDYKDYRNFIRQVIKSDQSQFVFKRF